MVYIWIISLIQEKDEGGDDEEDVPAYKTRRKETAENSTAARPVRNLRHKTPPSVTTRRESTASVATSEGKRAPRKRSPSKRQEEAPPPPPPPASTSPKRRVSQDVGKEAAKEVVKEAAVAESVLTTPAKKTNPGSTNVSPLPSSSPQTGSPSGVNRRTAVLFTRKAAAAFRVRGENRIYIALKSISLSILTVTH